MSEQSVYRYDAFISYNEADEAWVFDWLLPRLKEAGLTIAIDEETFVPGAPLLEEIERSIAESRFVLAVLTKAWVQDSWDSFEGLLVQHEDPGARLRKLIPLRLQEDVRPPRRIQLLHWVDLTDRSRREAQLERVIETLRGTATLPELRPQRALPTGWQRVWELRIGAIAAGAALLTLTLLALWLYSQRGEPRMTGVFNVAVADIGVLEPDGSMERNELSRRLSLWIFRALQAQNRDREGAEEVLLWHDSLGPGDGKGTRLGIVSGRTAEERAESAADLADRINAHVMIYGVQSASNGGDAIGVEFYVPRRFGEESNLTIGRYEFGEPIPIPPNFDLGDTLSSAALEERITDRASALFWLLLGIRQDALGRPAEALAIFEQAEKELPRWAEQGEGRENLYFFIGREHLFLQDFDAAEAALTMALASAPDFTRARIALGGVHFRRTQNVPKEERLEDPDLEKAISAYEEGVSLAQQGDAPLLEEIALLALASALRLRAEALVANDDPDAASADHDRAIDLLGQAIPPLAASEQYRILGQAHQFLGVSLMEKAQILERQGDLENSRGLYQQAADAFAACEAQEVNIIEDAFFATEVAPVCRQFRSAITDILASLGG